ncbi:MAG: hypothetical protein WCI00_09600 [bacterium]
MKLMGIPIIKSDERGIIYNCGKCSFVSRKKGSIGADHVHNDVEVIYLVKGKVELTIGNEVQMVEAPIMRETGSNVYHKVVAFTDIEFVINRDDE